MYGKGVIRTGADPIDKLVGGGVEPEIITTFYGPAGSGKTNIAMIASVNLAKQGKKVIYIDTEGGFSFERLKQLSKDNFEQILKNILLFKPTTFNEQKKYLYQAYNYIKMNPEVGLLVVDSISMLYRLELGDEEAREVNKELGRQMQLLSTITRKYNIPVIVTNQVYSLFDEDRLEVVGRDIVKYWSKCLVELKIIKEGVREAILRKHRFLPEGRKILFEIREDGIYEISENQ